MMRKAKIGELRNNLSRYLDDVRAGGRVVVYDRDTAIAELVPLPGGKKSSIGESKRTQELVRKGVLQPPTVDFRRWLKTHKPITVPGAESLVKAILEERETGL